MTCKRFSVSYDVFDELEYHGYIELTYWRNFKEKVFRVVPVTWRPPIIVFKTSIWIVSGGFAVKVARDGNLLDGIVDALSGKCGQVPVEPALRSLTALADDIGLDESDLQVLEVVS